MNFPMPMSSCSRLSISACAMGHNVLKIRPPLVLTADQAGLVIQALDEALGEA